MRAALSALALMALSACSTLPSTEAATTSEADQGTFPPSMRWDGQPQSAAWTARSFAALQDHGQPLLSVVPADIDSWCPAYPEAGPEGRAAFWTAMLSTLSKHESTWNPGAVGGGGKWFGLVQIAPATARGYGCAATTGEALKDGEANLSCAIRIAASTVPRDGVVAANMRGLAADWGPFHSTTKREDMRAWVRSQPYCQG